ncbi:MAG: V-type ATP synthase subunit I [Acutalibacteraceae bacterium]
MAIKKMKLVRISGPSSKLDKVITACCSLGSFQPENAAGYISETMGYTTVSEESPYAQNLQSLRELAESFGFDLEAKGKTKKAAVDNTVADYIKSLGDKLTDLNEQRKELAQQLEQCTGAIEKYGHFSGLRIHFEDIFSCKFISTRFGYLSKDGYIKLTKGYSDNPYILFCPCSSDNNGYWGAYFAPKDRVDEIDRIFAALHFERLFIPSAVGTADEIVENLKENVGIITEQKENIDKQIADILKQEGDKIRALYIRLSDLEQVFELRRYAVYHDKSCFFVGWIPASDEEKLANKLSKYTEFVAEFENPDKKSKINPPTKLKNFRIFRPYEYFVEMYGVPSYYDIDITAFVAVTYTLLFGIMFGDLGQGIVLSIIGLIMWKKNKSGLGKILVPCGVSSAFFGFIFGSVFGFEEALDPVYKKLGMSGKPISVMDSINTVLLLAIGIGVALVIVAMLINVATCIKKKKFGSALFSENGLTGICVYIGGASLVYTFMSGKTLIPSVVSVIMLVAGLVILYNKEIIAGSIDEHRFIKPESISDYLMQNLFECIEYILSYFSNTVSFLRVGAFVIVHASMMMVVFTLAGDVNTIKGVLVVEVGNIIVIALEGLLTGIQGLRLEFYEMFSRFYEGDGKPYNAVKLISKSK